MIKFEEKELKLLEEFLADRISYLEVRESTLHKTRKKDVFTVNFNVNLHTKVKSRISTGYSSKEISVLRSCVMTGLHQIESKVTINNVANWFSLSAKEQQTLVAEDTSKNILNKTINYKQGKKELYTGISNQKVLDGLQKIRNSSKVLMNKTSAGKIYKIAFVFDDKEILKFKTRHNLSITDLAFSPLYGKTPEEYAADKYGIIVSRPEAVSLLKSSPVHYFDENVKELMFAMLR